MKPPVAAAKKRHRLASPSLDPLAFALIDTVGPLYARLTLRASSITFIGGERLVHAADSYYRRRSRLIIAFRHPFGDEPQILTWAMHRGLHREARRLGVALPKKTHCLFLHGYEVPLWSGPFVRWILPRSGAMPVYHVKMDGGGLRTIRRALRDGAHPLALSPEGQSSYRSEIVPRVEKGVFQLAFWCAGELDAARRAEEVVVLPVSVHERHDDGDLSILEARCADLEKSFGITAPRPGPVDGPARRRALGFRLKDLDETILAHAEARYDIAKLGPPPDAGPTGGMEGESPDARVARREKRRAALLETALRRGEAMLGLAAEGDTIERVYRIRHEGWNRIYPEGDPAALARHARRLADLRAGEAWYAMRHMELVDLGYYLDSAYLEDGLRDGASPTVGRLSETLHNLYDFASRLEGGDISDRPRLLPRRLVLSIGAPLELRSRLPLYRKDRKHALDEATRDLETAWRISTKEFTQDE